MTRPSLFSASSGFFLLGLSLLAALALWPLRQERPQVVFGLVLLLALPGFAALLSAFWRRRKQEMPFPDSWRQILQERVSWYRRLDDGDKAVFEQNIQAFLAEKRISGVEAEIDDEVRVLIAAGALIPVFRYPAWRYSGIEEVLVFPDAFSHDYETEGPGRDLLGLVGEAELSRVVLLSKPDVLEGFRRAGNGPSPGIHEFLHLFDGADGTLDGVPGVAGEEAEDWLALVDREMARLERGQSRLDPYALTDAVEFFAVAGESFFLRPEQLRADHPELYQRLTRVFRQDPLQRPSLRREPSPYLFRPRRPARRRPFDADSEE